MEAEAMNERGGDNDGKKGTSTTLVNSTCQALLGGENVKVLDLRQTRKGWCQEMIGCEAKTEFKIFHKRMNDNEGKDGGGGGEPIHIATALEDASFLARCILRYEHFSKKEDK